MTKWQRLAVQIGFNAAGVSVAGEGKTGRCVGETGTMIGGGRPAHIELSERQPKTGQREGPHSG